MSPNGKYISYLAPWKNRLNVFVRPVSASTSTRVTSSTTRDIHNYGWANDDRLFYLKDKGGNENFNLYTINKRGKDERNLTPYPKARVRIYNTLYFDNEHMLIGLNKRDARYHDLYRINLQNAQLKLLEKNDGSIEYWLPDHKGVVRVRGKTKGLLDEVQYRHDESSAYRTISKTNFRDSFVPHAFDFKNEKLWAISNLGRDKKALVEFDPNTKKEKIIFQQAEYDMDHPIISFYRKKLAGVSYNGFKRENVFFDSTDVALQKHFENAFPNSNIGISSISKDGQSLILSIDSDIKATAYYFYDKRTKQIKHLADSRPWLKNAALAPTEPISFKSRDGLTIHGYLTLPVGRKHKNLPMVTYVHGGPWSRDSWLYSDITQFFANLGYAVLQVNFRGSTGYGRTFWEKSFKQWGLTMQDDITDAVAWATQRGVVDPKRVAIFGGSYGGYATLAGLAFTPDVYACGIDLVGPSNLFTLLESIPPYWENYRNKLYAMVGNPVKDKALLRAASPLFSADKIKAPLFIAQGANDPRVKQAESDQIVEALKKRGVEVKYMLKKNEGHGFGNEENRMEFFHETKRFLKQCIGY